MIKRFTVHYDGVCGPTDPGDIAFSFVITVDGEVVHSEAALVRSNPPRSARDAEYAGIIAAMSWLINNGHANDHVRFYGSALKTVNQMTKRWEVPDSYSYADMHALATRLAEKFADIAFTSVPRQDNLLAREKSREVLRENGIEPSAEKRIARPLPNGGTVNGKPTSPDGVRARRAARI